MANIGRGLMTIAGAVLGFWPGAATAQPFPGGLPACLAGLDVCNADLAARTTSLAACTAALNANSTSLATCRTSLEACGADLATCSTGLNTCDADLATCASTLNACDTSLTTCTADLSTCQAAPAAAASQFPASGQTTCWDSSGAVVDCNSTGQDGDVQAGAALSYTDNGDGTITDDTTKLMWEKKSADGSIHDVGLVYSWAQAFGHVAALNLMGFGGHSDWRLPNVRELQSIVDYGQHLAPTVSAAFNNNCGPGATPTILTGSCTAAPSINSSYWTSTTVARAPGAALAVIFWDGLVTEVSKGLTGSRYVRAVRGGS